MKTNRTTTVLTLLVGASLFLTATVRAMDTMPAAAAPSEALAKEGFDLAKAQAAYPLDTCVVSGEKLEGDMGGPIDYIHKEAGKPDRLVRFCCKSCVKDFKKDPAKYLKKIDDAAMAKMGHSEHMK
jgi:hypothetical protein